MSLRIWSREAMILAAGVAIGLAAALIEAPYANAVALLSSGVLLIGFIAWNLRLWSSGSRLQSILMSTALLIGLLVNWGFNVYASLKLEGGPFPPKAIEVLWETVESPLGTVWLLAPFVGLGWMTAHTATRESLRMGVVLFLIGVLILMYLSFHGYMNSKGSLLAKSWTSSALWIGTLPYKGAAVIFVLYLIGYGLGHDRTERTNDT